MNNNTLKYSLHEQLCNNLHETYIRKNHDYGDSFGKTFDMLGIISATTRITDKYNRFIELALNNNPQVEESLEDTLLDMANYCIMTVVELIKNTTKEDDNV